LTWVVSCVQEPRNVIRGEVEGLEVGDKIILSVEGPGRLTWIATDSVVVSKAGEFTLVTSVTGSHVQLTCLKAGEAFDPARHGLPTYFLEGYAELSMTGSVKDWHDMKISGGLYALPAMQRITSIIDSSNAGLKECVALWVRAKESRDTLLEAEVTKMIHQYMAFQGKDSLEKVFREKHPDKVYSASLLWYDYALRRQLDKYEAAFLALAPEVQDSPPGRLIRDYIAHMRTTEVGAVASDFTRADMNGNEITLSTFRGKYVLIDFWESWYDPCRKANKEMVELYAAARAKGANVEFISVTREDANDEKWREAIKEDKLTWIQLKDTYAGESKPIRKLYAVEEESYSLLISPEGKILYRDNPAFVIPEVKKILGL
jgi:peroxiredoxin